MKQFFCDKCGSGAKVAMKTVSVSLLINESKVISQELELCPACTSSPVATDLQALIEGYLIKLCPAKVQADMSPLLNITVKGDANGI